MNTNMTPVDWAKRPLQKYADFTGRAPRPEFWWYVLGYVIASVVLMIVESALGMNKMLGQIGPLRALLALALLLPTLAVGARRLHDTNRSGWWQAIAFVPYGLMVVAGALAVMGAGLLGLLAMMGIIGIIALVAAIVLIVFWAMPGTPGENRYGAPVSGDSIGVVAAE
jgi:uncharacterized membrane protein YhaH (DUF805 family)